MAVVIRASPNTCGQSAKARLVLINNDVFSYSLLMKWEQQLAAWLAERQVAQFIDGDQIVA